MFLIRRLLFKLSGKQDKDHNVPTSMIIFEAVKYAKSMIRGVIISLNMGTRGELIVGKGTKIVGKRKCYISGRVILGSNCEISAYSRKGITIGDNSKLGDRTIIRCSNIEHLGEGVVIGRGTSFDSDCFFGASGFISIGDNVIAGRGIKFHAENHNYSIVDVLIKEQGVTSKGISIGHNCWIGSNVVFVDGSSIGNGCVVAAGAVITKKFPENVVVGGIPARIIKVRGQSDD